MSNSNFKKISYSYLLKCGFSPVHKGFKLLLEALELLSKCRYTIRSLSDSIYLPLAQKHNIAPLSVQRNIKNAIDYAGLNGNMEVFSTEFEMVMCGNGTVPCAAFLYYVCDKIMFLLEEKTI